MLSVMFYLDIQTPNPPYLAGWHLLSWALPKTENFWRKFFGKINYLNFFPSESLYSETSKVCYCFWLISAFKIISDRASFLPPKSQSNGIRFWRLLVVISILCRTCDWLLIVQIRQVFFSKRSLLDFLTWVSPQQPLVYLVSLNFKTSYLIRMFD